MMENEKGLERVSDDPRGVSEVPEGPRMYRELTKGSGNLWSVFEFPLGHPQIVWGQEAQRGPSRPVP